MRSPLLPSLLLALLAPALSDGTGGGPISTLRWASTGGGWRSHFAGVGFANLFHKLGVLSRFSAISTTSGASWLSTQLFYSQQFYDRVVTSDVDSLHGFVLEWMAAYESMLDDAIQDTAVMNAELEESICNVTGLLEGRNVGAEPGQAELLSDLCHTLAYFAGDWALFVQQMLDYAAKSYGDSDFINRAAGSDNRLEPFKDTDLLIQAALVPNSRIRETGLEDDTAVYIGPRNGGSEIYTVAISAAYVVNGSGTAFEYGVEDDDAAVGTATTSSVHSFSEWEDFHLYPANNGTDRIPSDGYAAIDDGSDSLGEAFGGGTSASVIQVASISSAAGGTFSPLAPSAFTHGLSMPRHDITKGGGGVVDPGLRLFDSTVARFYDQPLLDGFAVCSQWPVPCGASDGIFIDGWCSDNPAFAINVGQYHTSGGDLSETLKVILTNTNQEWPDEYQYTQMLQYFDSPINEGVEPGAFNWPPGMWVPYQSPQIFADFMDSEMLDGLIEPIPGSNMTTAVLTGTTIDNEVFGVQAGQRVEILLINLNEPITTYIVTPELVRLYSEPLADMTKSIAENEELARRIKAFVEPVFDDDQETDDVSPSSGCPAPRRRKLLLLLAAVISMATVLS